MSFKSALGLLAALSGVTAVTFDQYDPQGYYLPSSGTASTTQFSISSEFGGGTSCGMNALPNGAAAGGQGGGPGYLYAAINQLGFGANPSVSGAGGPGGACGICYQITPVSSSGEVLSNQSLVFMIADECPASTALTSGPNCTPCDLSGKNSMGQTWNFDIAADAMSTDQYNTFYNGVTGGSNWLEVQFQTVACDGAVNPVPPLQSWGCMNGCSNNEAQNVCAGV